MPSQDRNRLLAALSAEDCRLLRPHLTATELKLRQDLERPNCPINEVYFMDAGIASVVAVQKNDNLVEVGVIGCEGMSGTAVVLGADSSPHHTFIQVAGRAQQIKTAALRKGEQVLGCHAAPVRPISNRTDGAHSQRKRSGHTRQKVGTVAVDGAR